MMESIELDIRIKAGDLYDYMLMHTYNSAAGLLGSGAGAMLFLAGLFQRQPLCIFAGALLLLYLPWTLFLKSRQQILRNPVFRESLHYLLSEEGITVSQGETQTGLDWEHVVKVVSTRQSIIVYTGKINATILPNREMGDKRTDVIQMISAHVPPKRVKIRS